jgi:DNA-binding transcriptional LysR family regulator
MELRHLRYFVRVAEELHFGRAAERLGMSQPPLSQQIRALEAELGVDLLERTSRRVTLTEAGALFLIEARKTLVQAAHAIDVARRARHGELGELSIGFVPSVPFTTFVADALAAFREAYPAVRLNLAEMSRTQQIRDILAEELDIGFIRNFDRPPCPAEIEVSLLFREPLLVAMRRDNRLAAEARALVIEDLRDQPFVLYHPDVGVGFNEHLVWLCTQAGFTPYCVQEATGVTTLLGLVAAGMGITVITRSLAALQPTNIVFRPLENSEVMSGLWLIHRNSLSSAARRFVDLLHEPAEAEAADDRALPA